MEKTRVNLKREYFFCSICEDLLKEPVSLTCGHNYCRICIDGLWQHRNIYKCPQCRHTLRERPCLMTNFVLVEIVKNLRKSGPAPGPEDVACDVCTGRKLKALKSCLSCRVSYCDFHLQTHLEAPAFILHKLVPPSNQLQEIICPQHNEKIFCAVDQNEDQDVVTAERRKREKEVDQSREKIQQRIQDREEEVKLLQQEEEDIKVSGDKALKDCRETLKQMIQILQIRMSHVEEQIRSQKQKKAAKVQGLQEQLEQEISDLKKKDADLQKLSLDGRLTVFLQDLTSISEVSEDTLSSRTHVLPHHCFEEVTAAMSACRDQQPDLLRTLWTNISLVFAQEPKTRDQFLKYSQYITLDRNTADRRLHLSKGNRHVKNMSIDQYLPHHPPGHEFPQALSKETLNERCYFEVEIEESARVAVSYKSISISGPEGKFGFNDQSWSLHCKKCDYAFTHNKVTTGFSSDESYRLGVYLDQSAGLLSFYSISETMTLLHRVQTTFTQPLHAGVQVFTYCEFVNLNC